MSYTFEELAIIDIIQKNPTLVNVSQQIKPILTFTYKIVIDADLKQITETLKKPKKDAKKDTIDVIDDIKKQIVAEYDTFRSEKKSAEDSLNELKNKFKLEKLSAQKISAWKKELTN